MRSCFHLGACDFNVSSTAPLRVSSHRRFIGHRVPRSALCLFTISVLLVCCLGASLCSSRPLVALGLRSIEIRSCVNNDNVIISNATGLMIMFFKYQIIRLKLLFCQTSMYACCFFPFFSVTCQAFYFQAFLGVLWWRNHFLCRIDQCAVVKFFSATPITCNGLFSKMMKTLNIDLFDGNIARSGISDEPTYPNENILPLIQKDLSNDWKPPSNIWLY